MKQQNIGQKRQKRLALQFGLRATAGIIEIANAMGERRGLPPVSGKAEARDRINGKPPTLTALKSGPVTVIAPEDPDADIFLSMLK